MTQAAVSVAVFPAANAPTTVRVSGGRIYTCMVGAATLIVPEGDALQLIANGWLKAAMDAAGTTAQRPVPNQALGISAPPTGFHYFDSTLGANVIWNGKNWISHSTGAIA